MSDHDAAQFWESRYRESDRIWSGEPNRALVAVVTGMTPGRALDLGCGEGGDSVWLAEGGWWVTGIDISKTAVARARAAAALRGIPSDQKTWIVEDLATWQPTESYELVTSCFLHSPVEFPRADVLQRAARAVTHGGHLLIVGHAAAPPWADEHAHHHRFLTPTEELDELQLADDKWQVLLAETHSRDATGPGGEHATLEDAVLFARRR